MMFTKGDVLRPQEPEGDRDRLFHAAVLWSDSYTGEGDFHGIMLTHTPPSKRYDNILMSEKHFNNNLGFRFHRTHFVNQMFIKLEDWGPFYKAGELTGEGIDFISNNLTGTNPVSFRDYHPT